MIKNFDVKKLYEEDFPEMNRVLQSASRDWNSAVLKDCFHAGYQSFGIYFQDTMLGFVIIRVIPDAWEIVQIVIDRAFQRQGLAFQLMQSVFEEAKKNGINKMQLEVRASNHPAIALYQQLHFREVGIRKKYYPDGEDAVLMDCVL